MLRVLANRLPVRIVLLQDMHGIARAGTVAEAFKKVGGNYKVWFPGMKTEFWVAREHLAKHAEPKPTGEQKMTRRKLNIAASRKRLQMSQQELADTLGVPVNTLARWERGVMAVQHEEILRLALDQLEGR